MTKDHQVIISYCFNYLQLMLLVANVNVILYTTSTKNRVTCLDPRWEYSLKFCNKEAWQIDGWNSYCYSWSSYCWSRLGQTLLTLRSHLIGFRFFFISFLLFFFVLLTFIVRNFMICFLISCLSTFLITF